jgi:hypothetical protein
LVAVSTSCGAPQEPDDFTVDNETGFLAACAEPVEDTALTNAICRCVFEETSSAYSFADFQDLDESLTLEIGAELPAEIEAIIAACVIEEADL